MRRLYIGAVALLVTEAYLYWHYAQLDAEFHYWLHGLLGAAVGLAGLSTTRLVRRRRRPLDSARWRLLVTPWEAAGLGHLCAAFPDILFLTVGLPHDYWMDVFALHITVHFLPAPVLTALALFLLMLTAYGLVLSQRNWAAAAVLSVAMLTVVVAIQLAAVIPTNIQDLRNDPRLAYHRHSAGDDRIPDNGHEEHRP